MKNVKIVSSIIIAGLVLSLNGCSAEEETQESLYPEKPTISVSSLEVLNGGSELTWKVNIQNKHQSTRVVVAPWNDTTYYFNFNKNYNDGVELMCNTDVQGSFADCNKVDEIVCDRVGIGSDYSEYRCDFKIDGVIYPQFKEKMRVATMSNGNPSTEVLVTLGTEYWYEANGYEQSKYVYETDETKMFNVFSGQVGP